MAFKKTLAQRLFNISQISSQSLTKCRISSSSIGSRVPPNTNTANIAHDPGDNAVFRRFLHKRAVSQPAMSPELREFAAGGNMVEKFKSLGIATDRIRLDCLRPPACESLASDPDRSDVKDGLTVEDARKLLRVARMEMVKWKLREIQKSWIPYSEFVRVCRQGCDDPAQGLEIAQMLDESGAVIVLGNVVYLKPEQVAKAIEGLIPLPATIIPNDARRKELEQMEMQKAVIDKRAEKLVTTRALVWTGLPRCSNSCIHEAHLLGAHMGCHGANLLLCHLRLLYCLLYLLSQDLEGAFVQSFFQSRFSTKQKRLMKLQNFDIARYNELRRACFPNSSAKGLSPLDSMVYDNAAKVQLEYLHH